MPINPLVTAASSLAPVEPATRFFDPGLSTDIMQRYALAANERAFAEEVLTSADKISTLANFNPQQRQFELDRQVRQRELWDRDDEEYVDKKNFETVRGEFLENLASVPFDDPDFDTKVAGLLTDPEAAKDDAVKAMLNFKLQRRAQLESDAIQEQRYQDRLASEIGQALGEAGLPLETVSEHVNKDTGRLNLAGLLHTVGATDYGTKQALLRRKQLTETYGEKDPTVTGARFSEQLDDAVKERKDSLAKLAESYQFKLSDNADQMIEKAGDYDADSFVAIVEDEMEGYDANGVPYDATKTADKDMVRKAARSLWAAAHRKATLPSARKMKDEAEAPAKSEKAKAWLSKTFSKP